MNMPAKSFSNEISTRQFHYSSICVILIFVLIPWALIAIPGERKNKSSGELIQFFGQKSFGIHAEHGWPAIHGVSVKCSRQLINSDSSSSLDPIHDSLLKPKKTFDVFHFREFEEHRFIEGFWTNVDRWPTRYVNTLGLDESKIFFEYRIYWPGLIVNALFVAVVSGSLFWYCEARIRRHRSLLKITLIELALLGFVLCALTAWGAAMTRFAQQQEIQLRRFQTQIPKSAFSKVWVERKEVFPTFVSRLLNYKGVGYPLAQNIFQPISKIHVNPTDIVSHYQKELASIDLPFAVPVGDRGYSRWFPAKNIIEIDSSIKYLQHDEYDELKRAINLRELNIHEVQNLDVSEAQRFVATLESIESLELCHIRFSGSKRIELDVYKTFLNSQHVNSLELWGINSRLADLLLKLDTTGKNIRVKLFTDKSEIEFSEISQESMEALSNKGVFILRETDHSSLGQF